MTQRYCSRCLKNITYMYTYSQYCRDCKERRLGNVPDYIPDKQIEMYRRLKNV